MEPHLIDHYIDPDENKTHVTKKDVKNQVRKKDMKKKSWETPSKKSHGMSVTLDEPPEIESLSSFEDREYMDIT